MRRFPRPPADQSQPARESPRTQNPSGERISFIRSRKKNIDSSFHLYCSRSNAHVRGCEPSDLARCIRARWSLSGGPIACEQLGAVRKALRVACARCVSRCLILARVTCSSENFPGSADCVFPSNCFSFRHRFSLRDQKSFVICRDCYAGVELISEFLCQRY